MTPARDTKQLFRKGTWVFQSWEASGRHLGRKGDLGRWEAPGARRGLDGRGGQGGGALAADARQAQLLGGGLHRAAGESGHEAPVTD